MTMFWVFLAGAIVGAGLMAVAYLAQIKRTLDHVSQLNGLMFDLTQEIRHMDAKTQASLDNLTTAVTAETTVEASVETLLTGLAAEIATLKAGATDPAVIAAIDSATAIVTANNAKFQAAVTANTGI
jgi:hypothetical protein